jgi:hypothetical protein
VHRPHPAAYAVPGSGGVINDGPASGRGTIAAFVAAAFRAAALISHASAYAP